MNRRQKVQVQQLLVRLLDSQPDFLLALQLGYRLDWSLDCPLGPAQLLLAHLG